MALTTRVVRSYSISEHFGEPNTPPRRRPVSADAVPNLSELTDCNHHTPQVSDKWQPDIARQWLEECSSNHQHICGDMVVGHVPVSRLRLINVQTEEIVEGLTSPIYAALSYVWYKAGKNGEKGPPNHGYISRLPRPIPPLIADTIEVCKQLSIDYLWVDKYCVDQSDKDVVHHQVHQMDRIYYNSLLTVIGAYGTDEREGLPGVSAARATFLKLHIPKKLARTQSFPSSGFIKNRSLIHDKHTPVSTIRDLQDTIQHSTTWSTRGWTLQEALLSRRCLVFTEEQMYFECRGGLCRHEADPPGRQQADRKTVGIFRELDQDPEKRLDDYCLSRFSCIEKYSKRELTKATDALYAFAGIDARCQKLAPRIRHLAGMQFVLSPSTSSPRSEVLDDFVKDLPRTHLAFSLGWASKHSAWDKACPRRRPDFPSYSSFGWEGEVSNTWWGVVKLLAFDAFVGEILVEDSSGQVAPYQEKYAALTRKEANTFIPAAIHIPSVAVPRSLIQFEWVNHTIEWSVCGYHTKLRLCEGASDPLEFGRALKGGDFTLILLGGRGWWDSISEHSLLLVLSARSDHWVRVGSMRVDCGLEALCQQLKLNEVDTSEHTLFRLK